VEHTVISYSLPCDAYAYRGICCRAVSFHHQSVTWIYCVETTELIIKHWIL